jgi:hypothetical protein
MKPYEVFISFKNLGLDGRPTPDVAAARRVYEALQAQGIRVFFSEEELSKMGKGHFTKALAHALESARVLVLVASCLEHVVSPYVQAEWDSFVNDVHSGRKEGELFLFNCGDLTARELPLFLRRHQMFAGSDLARLVKFIGNALPRRVVLEDLIRVSLHCHRPRQREDKVYLLGVVPDEHGRHKVAAFWGPRKARRLSSQVKGVGMADRAEVEGVVEELRREKEASGYVAKPLRGLLTTSARKLLEADLGIGGLGPHPALSPVGPSTTASEQRLRTALLAVLRDHRKGNPEWVDRLVRNLIKEEPAFDFLAPLQTSNSQSREPGKARPAGTTRSRRPGGAA